MTVDPNSFDQELKDGQNPNPELDNKGTEGAEGPNLPTPAGEQVVDYQKKFSESSKEALRLLEEKKKLEEAIAEKDRLLAEKAGHDQQGLDPENLYPGFEELDPQAKDNLLRFANTVAKNAQEKILRDPAIAYAKETFNEKKWDKAYESVSKDFPELNKDEFKAKYFKASNVPDNIENILRDVAKIHLFDKAKEIGAKEAKKEQEKIDLERTTGGDKTPTSRRSLEEWQRMQSDNPAKFAKLSKEYNADIASGKI